MIIRRELVSRMLSQWTLPKIDNNAKLVKDEQGNENNLLHVGHDDTNTIQDFNGVYPDRISHASNVEKVNGSGKQQYTSEHQSSAILKGKSLLIPENSCLQG